MKNHLFSESELINVPIEQTIHHQHTPFYGDVIAGFPSPADDFIQNRISLDQRYLHKIESTFINRVAGNSMSPEYEVDDLIVLRSDIEPRHLDDIVVSINSSAYTLKRYDMNKNQLFAINTAYKNIIQLTQNDIVLILGVVTTIIREKRRV